MPLVFWLSPPLNLRMALFPPTSNSTGPSTWIRTPSVASKPGNDPVTWDRRWIGVFAPERVLVLTACCRNFFHSPWSAGEAPGFSAASTALRSPSNRVYMLPSAVVVEGPSVRRLLPFHHESPAW